MSLFSDTACQVSTPRIFFPAWWGFLGGKNGVMPPLPDDLCMYDFTTNRCCIVLDLKLDVKHGKASVTALYIKISNDIPLINTGDKMYSKLCEQKKHSLTIWVLYDNFLHAYYCSPFHLTCRGVWCCLAWHSQLSTRPHSRSSSCLLLCNASYD